MACMFLPHGLSVPRPANLSAFASSPFLNPLSHALPLPRARRSLAARSVAPVSCALRALVFDCDGVILESEHLHRQAYNDAFAHFGVRCSGQPLNWGLEFYDELQNRIGGGKPKMRWYFKEHGWPSSSIFEKPPESDEDRAKLIDTIQFSVILINRGHFADEAELMRLFLEKLTEPAVTLCYVSFLFHGIWSNDHKYSSYKTALTKDWKTERYKDIIRSGAVKPRPGVLRLMDEAKAAGKKLAVCSAATKSSVILCLENLIGMERFQGLDCFLAGDDVKEKKPDPSIYLTAVKKLGVSGTECLVVEDSVIGLQAAKSAGMACVISYTSSTANQDFKEAIAIYPDLANVRLKDLELLLQSVVAAK